MKNILLFLSLLLAANVGYSQAKVFSSGKTFIGNNTGVIDPDEQLQVNGLVKNQGETVETNGVSATLLMDRQDRAAMLLGAGGGAGFSFDENFRFEIRANNRATLLTRALSAGTPLMIGEGNNQHVAFGGAATSAVHRLRVAGSIISTGTFILSDKNLKTDIKPFESSLQQVMDLNPVTYKYNGLAGVDDNQKHIGLLAQELKEVAPDFVSSEDYYTIEDGEKKTIGNYLQIDDSAIKYLLINAIKEQQELIENKDLLISELQGKISSIEEKIDAFINQESTGRVQLGATLNFYDFAELNQNNPNPFNGSTSIDYVIPTDAKSSQLVVLDMRGRIIKTIEVDHTGEGTLNLKAIDIPSGTYTYRLLVDGRSIDTKKMIISQ